MKQIDRLTTILNGLTVTLHHKEEALHHRQTQ